MSNTITTGSLIDVLGECHESASEILIATPDQKDVIARRMLKTLTNVVAQINQGKVNHVVLDRSKVDVSDLNFLQHQPGM